MMNKALLLLLCLYFPGVKGKDAGWQWYNEKINPEENKPVPAAPVRTGRAETDRATDNSS